MGVKEEMAMFAKQETNGELRYGILFYFILCEAAARARQIKHCASCVDMSPSVRASLMTRRRRKNQRRSQLLAPLLW